VVLFEKAAIGPAITGLIFEAVTPILFLVYGFQICFSKGKVRPTYAFNAILCYIISTLPVFFLGTQMQSSRHALYLTTFFGVISFFCWARAISKTPQQNVKTADLVTISTIPMSTSPSGDTVHLKPNTDMPQDVPMARFDLASDDEDYENFDK
jgi:hypothetical protein